MDRPIVYTSAIPRSTDYLTGQQAIMVALGYLMQAAIGTGPAIGGLAVTATSPASMTVNVGAGFITQLTTLEATAYGSLPADTSDTLVKMGINSVGVTPFTMTAPATAGQSVCYLIEAAFLESDTGSVVLGYFNSANILTPYSGPNNLGTSQNTLRTQRCQLQMKAGVPATTGSQTIPAVDSGYVPVAVITVAYGATTITAANIAVAPNAPYLQQPLEQARYRLFANKTVYVSTTGNDSTGDGSALAPWATMQHAWNTIQSYYDLNGFVVTVQLANGTYTAALNAAGAVVGQASTGSVIFQGNLSSSSAVVVNANAPSVGAVSAQNGGLAQVQNMTLNNSGANGSCGYASSGGALTLGAGMVLGTVPTSGSHLYANSGGTINVTASYTLSFSGAAQQHYVASQSTINFTSGISVTVTGGPTFSVAFARATAAGFLLAIGVSYTGSVTGPRYQADLNGVIYTNGGGAGYFPGSSAGVSPSGGQYE